MRRDLSPEDRRLWARVARTVRRAPGIPPAEPELASSDAKAAATPPPAKTAKPASRPVAPPAPPRAARLASRPAAAPEPLEPRRQRRLARERDPIEAVLDLHGFGRFEAEDRLVAFLSEARARGHRAVMVVTGKGSRGGGVIRTHAAEWLSGPRLRGIVAGFSGAHRRHGGEGALYVTLKRR